MKEVPRVLIASDRSGSGKTIISSGIMGAIGKRRSVQGFKAGPDFIDPGFHLQATGKPSINLDLWMMGERGVTNSLSLHSGNSLCVIEGVMGFYDGIGRKYSTFELSKKTETPVILVMDCSSMSTTAGAIVKGLVTYCHADVKGVIFNKVGSEKHYAYCKDSLPKGVKSLGYIPYDRRVDLPSRHLGLVTTEDNPQAASSILKAAELAEEHIDLEGIISIAESAPPLPDAHNPYSEKPSGKLAAVAADSAFCFYYTENIERLKRKYEVKFFSPLLNEFVKGADFVYLGGGYPELHAKELEKAEKTRRWLRQSSYAGCRVFGECGGLIFMSKNLIGTDGKTRKMAGIFDIDIMAKGRLTLAYTKLKAARRNPISRKGSTLRGHEFHSSEAVRVEESKFAFDVKMGRGIAEGKDGALSGESIGTYNHFHFSQSGFIL